MIRLSVLLLAYAGIAALCAATPKHQLEVIGRSLAAGEQARLRRCGVAALVAAYGCAGTAVGWRFGAVLWCGAIMVAGLALTLNLPYRPRLAARAGVLAALASLALLVASAAWARPWPVLGSN